jgi:hypothetical protein
MESMFSSQMSRFLGIFVQLIAITPRSQRLFGHLVVQNAIRFIHHWRKCQSAAHQRFLKNLASSARPNFGGPSDMERNTNEFPKLPSIHRNLNPGWNGFYPEGQ